MFGSPAVRALSRAEACRPARRRRARGRYVRRPASSERHNRLGDFSHRELETVAIHRDGGRRDEERTERGLVEVSPASGAADRTAREAATVERTMTRGDLSGPNADHASVTPRVDAANSVSTCPDVTSAATGSIASMEVVLEAELTPGAPRGARGALVERAFSFCTDASYCQASRFAAYRFHEWSLNLEAGISATHMWHVKRLRQRFQSPRRSVAALRAFARLGPL